jgi:hypothetical protein
MPISQKHIQKTYQKTSSTQAKQGREGSQIMKNEVPEGTWRRVVPQTAPVGSQACFGRAPETILASTLRAFFMNNMYDSASFFHQLLEGDFLPISWARSFFFMSCYFQSLIQHEQTDIFKTYVLFMENQCFGRSRPSS